MSVDYNKPLCAKFEIEGVVNEAEKKMAGEILLRIYNLATKVVNNGGIERFNTEWYETHPDWDNRDEYRNEVYTKAYYSYFKRVADEFSDKVRSDGGLTYKLREFEPCLINFEQGYVTIYGYKEWL